MDETIYLMLRVGTLAMALALAGSAAAQTAPPTCRTPECVKAQLSAPYQAQQRARWQGDVDALGAHMVQETKTTGADLARMTPEMMTAYAVHVRAEEAQLSALAVKLGRPAPDWTAADAALATIIQKELACRVDAKCLADRQTAALSTEICGHIVAIRALTARIATEKANPSGVVSLSDLHSSGEDIQAHQAQMAAAKVRYSTAAGKAFDASVCR